MKSFIIIFLPLLPLAFAKVSLKVDGRKAEVSNDLVKFNFKKDGTISSLYVEGVNIVDGADKSFYLDWTGAEGVVKFGPSSITIVEQTDSRAHFYWVQESSRATTAFNIELHYILEDGLRGIYSYAKYTNDKSSNISFAETRMIYRYSPDIFTQSTNQMRTDSLPTKAEISKCKTVQDATYEFPNGTYYTKYDYAVYIRETQYEGVFGNGYGAFVVSPSREYHGGGPMKQDLTVHIYSLVSNYFLSAHFGTPEINAPPGWVHIYGPFLLYYPTGNDEAILSSVENQVKIEQDKWPYSFVDDEEYPLERGSVNGTIDGQTKATVTLYDSLNEDFDTQQLGYLYTTNTNDDGFFNINNIRPGTYKIVVYPLAGQGSEILLEKEVTITAGNEEINFTIQEPEDIVWAIGKANRRADEFFFADQPRNYQWEHFPPQVYTFYAGEQADKSWYYAQTSPGGAWSIIYEDVYNNFPRTLRLALAAASKSNLLLIHNNLVIGNLFLDNDASIYRSAMQSGRYRSYTFSIDADQINSGQNTLQLVLISGAVMYDAISLQINY